MASIQSVTIIMDRPQSDNARKVKYQINLNDDIGGQFTQEIGPKTLPADVDPAVDGQAIAQNLLASLPEDEAREAESAIEKGDGLDRVLNSRWGAARLIAKRLIRRMMREKDPRLVILLEPLINYLRDNYTGHQLIQWLEITPQQGVKLNSRINAVLSDVGTVKAQMLVFNTTREEIE